MLFLYLLLLFVAIYAALLIFNRLTCGICKSSTCLVGKTALVTGGNSGIGFQVCLNLASRGCKVIIADCVDSEKSRLEIIKRTENPNITAKFVNLASFKSIREFAVDLHKDIDKLDILVNNAGTAAPSHITEDGLDSTMQINYFGPFLLTHLLIDLLKKSEKGRIVFTASFMSFYVYLFINTFGRIGHIVRLNTAYGQSKLATVIASDVLARKLNHTKITVNSLHPGLVDTRIFNTFQTNLWNRIVVFVSLELYVKLSLAKDAYEGSQTTVHVAVSQEASNVTGQFFADCRPFWKPYQAYDKQFCSKVWAISEDAVHLEPEERL